MNLNRRSFIGTTAAAAFPYIIPTSVLGDSAPSKLVRVGIIGCGRISRGFEIPNLMRLAEKCSIVALSDLDSVRLAAGKEAVEHAYRKGKRIAGYTVATYKDYRELCASPEVDAVMVCVPDFWHALCAAEAICNRKALWLQKPFTQTIREGRLIANLAKRFNTVVQVGSQQRSAHQFREACERAHNGRRQGDTRRGRHRHRQSGRQLRGAARPPELRLCDLARSDGSHGPLQ